MKNLLVWVWLRKRLGLRIAATVLLLCFGSVGLAAQKPEQNPLEITTPDPLLPKPPVERPLSPLERKKLKTDLDELNAQASTQLKAGNAPTAFEIWYRELRLRRSLGTLEEVQALGRVGDTAWQNSLSKDLQNITGRLDAIKKEAEAKPPVDLALLQALGQAYQQVRSPAPALAIYQQILADAQQRQDVKTQEATLKTMAQLHIDWFDYPKAAATYEQLLTMAQTQGDYFNQVVYIQQLAYIYDKAKQPENSLKVKQRLEESYLNNKDLEKLSALKLSMGADYEALGKPDDASQKYQEAYSLALSVQQFAYASEALQKLGALYRSYDQLDYALQVYQIRVQVDRQSYNFYGLMNSYDQMGQIYLQQKNYAQALAAFQQGLELAKSLKYQENYFTTQIDRVTKQSSQ